MRNIKKTLNTSALPLPCNAQVILTVLLVVNFGTNYCTFLFEKSDFSLGIPFLAEFFKTYFFMVCFRTIHLESKLNSMHLKNNEFDENSTLIKMLNNRHISKTSYFPVTKPPFGLGKRIIVARPGLVVVKSGKLISYFSMGFLEIKIILNNKTISYGIKVQLNI